MALKNPLWRVVIIIVFVCLCLSNYVGRYSILNIHKRLYLFSLLVFLSVSVCLCLTCLSVCLSLSVCLLSLSVSACLCLSVCLSLFLSLRNTHARAHTHKRTLRPSSFAAYAYPLLSKDAYRNAIKRYSIALLL